MLSSDYGLYNVVVLGKLIRTRTISGSYNRYLGIGCFEGLIFTTETITGSESALEHGTKFRCGASGASNMRGDFEFASVIGW
jgi:hypothetical protein